MEERCGEAMQPEWTQDPTWRRHRAALADLPHDMRLIEICAGVGTAGIAMSLIQGKDAWKSVGVWDIDACLAPVIEMVHGTGTHVHVGLLNGNIMAAQLNDFPSADVMVAGPPCPPFSSLGNRRALEDRRAAVFMKTIEIIEALACRPHDALRMFVLENVMGIAHRANGTGQPPLEVIKSELIARLPRGWTVQHWALDARDFGLPQRRSRIYIVGRNPEWFPVAPTPPPTAFRGTVQCSDIIDRTDNVQRSDYTPIQRANIAGFKSMYAVSMRDTKRVGEFAFVDVSRSCTGRTLWGAGARHENVCECLTASGPRIHVFALGEGTGTLSVDRPLRSHERAMLQGFPKDIARAAGVTMNDMTCKRIFGNAMAVPVIGSMLARELTLMLRHCNPGTRQHLFTRGYVPAPSPPRPACDDIGPDGTMACSAQAQLPRGSSQQATQAPEGQQQAPELVRDSGSGESRSPSMSASEDAQEDVNQQAVTEVAAWGRAIAGHWTARRGGRAPQPARWWAMQTQGWGMGSACAVPKRARAHDREDAAEGIQSVGQSMEDSVPAAQPDPPGWGTPVSQAVQGPVSEAEAPAPPSVEGSEVRVEDMPLSNLRGRQHRRR